MKGDSRNLFTLIYQRPIYNLLLYYDKDMKLLRHCTVLETSHAKLDFSQLPNDMLIEIFKDSDFKALQNLSLACTTMQTFIFKDCTLKILAEVNGLPYSDTFKKLVRYYEMPMFDLITMAAGNGDIRVIKFVMKEIVEITGEVPHRWINSSLASAARNGHTNVMDSLLPFTTGSGSTSCNYNVVMKDASRGGHTIIVNQMLSLGADDYEVAMQQAARGGYQTLVNDMLKRGAHNYEKTMQKAARGNHPTIVNQMLKLGARDYGKTMSSAARYGNLEIVDQMIELGVNCKQYERAMICAAKGGHKLVFNQMFELYASTCSGDKWIGDYLNTSILEATKHGNHNIVMAISAIPYPRLDYDRVLEYAAGRGDKTIVDFSIERNACCFTTALVSSAKGGHRCMIDHILQIVTRDSDTKLSAGVYNAVMAGSARGGHQHIVNYMLKFGATDYSGALVEASKGGHIHIVSQMLDLGARCHGMAINTAILRGHFDVVAIIKSWTPAVPLSV